MPSSRRQSISAILGFPPDIVIDLLREDELHPLISGNKFRKLKYNVLEAKQAGVSGLMTFGGAYSNHILATAAACQEAGLRSIGLIRGEELSQRWKANPTLSRAVALGMRLIFIRRDDYALKDEFSLEQWARHLGWARVPNVLLLPEGGTNELAVKGCEEILEGLHDYDRIVCAVGTGGTLAGLIRASAEHQHVLGISALPDTGINDLIRTFTTRTNWSVDFSFHGGAYARISPELVEFINGFYQKSGIPLDPVYTAKMIRGLQQLLLQGMLDRRERVLAIHTGGLQGIAGMNQKLERKQWPKIQYSSTE